MKKIFIVMFLLLQLALYSASVYGQTVEGLRLKRDYYYDNLDKIIDAIGEDLNIRFIYEREHLNHYRTSSRPDETKAPNEGIEITWDNADGDYYIVEGVTESLSLVKELDEDEEMPSQSFKLDYTQGESATLSSVNFNYYGKYAVSVLHIRPEYAIMSRGGAINSSSLVDVRGNIDGGYGIFTGVNCVTDTVTVRVQSSPF